MICRFLIIVILGNLPILTEVPVHSMEKHSFYNNKPTFCDVYKRPAKFANKRLRFMAHYSEGFTQTPVLSNSKCEGRFIQPSFKSGDSGTSGVLEIIQKSLIEQEDGVTSVAEFEFVGILQIVQPNTSLPIEGILENYIFVIESATLK